MAMALKGNQHLHIMASHQKVLHYNDIESRDAAEATLDTINIMIYKHFVVAKVMC